MLSFKPPGALIPQCYLSQAQVQGRQKLQYKYNHFALTVITGLSGLFFLEIYKGWVLHWILASLNYRDTKTIVQDLCKSNYLKWRWYILSARLHKGSIDVYKSEVTLRDLSPEGPEVLHDSDLNGTHLQKVVWVGQGLSVCAEWFLWCITSN